MNPLSDTHLETRRNRTGASRDPALAREMTEGMGEFAPDPEGSPFGADAVRCAATEDAHGRPAASLPEVRGDGEARASEALLLDKMGARLAFERAGVRLYQALVSKRDGDPDPFPGAPSREDLQHLLDEEAEHFRMLSEAILERGGDPTVVTPCANTEGVLGMGIQKVVTDPRMDLKASLEAVLLAELADNEAWETLVAIADVAGEDALVSRFEKALEQEDEHLAKVRGWLAISAGLSEPNGEAPDEGAPEKKAKAEKRAR